MSHLLPVDYTQNSWQNSPALKPSGGWQMHLEYFPSTFDRIKPRRPLRTRAVKNYAIFTSVDKSSFPRTMIPILDFG